MGACRRQTSLRYVCFIWDHPSCCLYTFSADKVNVFIYRTYSTHTYIHIDAFYCEHFRESECTYMRVYMGLYVCMYMWTSGEICPEHFNSIRVFLIFFFKLEWDIYVFVVSLLASSIDLNLSAKRVLPINKIWSLYMYIRVYIHSVPHSSNSVLVKIVF